jgi:hypothetical protein
MNAATNKANSPVVVLFDDDVARSAALNFCNNLVERFWAQYGFEVSWCSFELLGDPHAARNAAAKAKAADLVVFATKYVPAQIRAWIETWLNERSDHEGALVDLSGASEAGPETQVYLRTVAHRAGMDYLTQPPQNMSWCIPDSPESCSHRADTVTSVLNEILHHHVAPPHLRVSPAR